MAPREKTFLLAPAEGRVLNWLAQRMPARVMPDHMTILGVVVAAGVFLGRDRRRRERASETPVLAGEQAGTGVLTASG